MYKKLVLVLFFLAIVFVRYTQTTQSTLLNPDKLPSESFTIALNRDTVLHTAKGAIIRIPGGAINAGNAATVRLEIKEAYKLADMVKAGLTTVLV